MKDPQLITVAYPRDQVTINRIHMAHHSDLIRGFLLPSVRNQDAAAETGSAEEDAILRELEGTYVQWAEGEVLRFGYLSLYHLWERQIVSLIEDQLAQRGRTFDKRRGPLTACVRRALSTEFAAALDDSIWEALDKSRSLANEIKHGSRAPCEPGEADWVAISEEDFDDLAKSLERFWDALPYKVDYSSYHRASRFGATRSPQ